MVEITLIGNIGTVPEVKRFSRNDGTEGAYCSFRVGGSVYNRETKNYETMWFSVSTFDANIASRMSLDKGTRVKISGDYSDSIYQRNDGTYEISRRINAFDIKKIGGAAESKNNPINEAVTSAPQQQPAQQRPVQQQPAPVSMPSVSDDLPF